MKTIAAIAIALSFASPAFAKGKSRHQFDVCYLDHGRVAVVGTSDKQAKALAVASFLDESKADHGAHHFVIVEELDEKGDVK